MICPVEIARDVSALQAARVGDNAKHDLLPEGRSGAGDESTGSDFASHGEEDHVVAGGRDHWSQRSVDAALAGAVKSSVMTDCSTGGRASLRRSGCRWPWWKRCWDYTGIDISI